MAATSWMIKFSWTKPPMSMNVRLQPYQRARLTKEIRQEAFLRVKHAKVPKGLTRIRITLIYRPKDSRRRDAINMAPTLKAIEDGIVDARIVPDDTPEFIDPVMPRIEPPLPGQKTGEIWVLLEDLGV